MIAGVAMPWMARARMAVVAGVTMPVAVAVMGVRRVNLGRRTALAFAMGAGEGRQAQRKD